VHRTFGKIVWSLAALAAICGATSARAGMITYPDFPTWRSAVSEVTTVTIPDPSPQQFINFGSGSASVTYSGVTFSTNATLSDGALYNVGVLLSGNPAVVSSQQQIIGVANILITFPSPVVGFALNYGTLSGSAVTFTVTNGDTVTQGSTGSFYTVPDFVGATDSAPFTTVLVTSTDSVLNLNNVSYALSAVPEPTSLALLGVSTAALLVYSRLRRRQASV
jgi:hypothetical protein